MAGMSDSDDDEMAKLEIRDGKSRTVTFEQTGKNCFSVSTNFSCPDAIVSILK